MGGESAAVRSLHRHVTTGGGRGRFLSGRVVILNGMQRGGTNIVWNLLQSHPALVSPVYETGQVIFPLWMGRGRLGRLARTGFRLAVRARIPAALAQVDAALHRYKLCTLEHEDNRYKSPCEIYRRSEIEASVLVTKSLGDDVVLTPALADYFPDSRCISVVRNGLAVAEGWIRRGATPGHAAAAYVRFTREVFCQERVLPRHLVVKFEDCLADPVGQLQRMCRFIGVDSAEIGKIRLKAKSVVDAAGNHRTAFGEEGRKIWIDAAEVRSYLDSSVTENQVRRLPGEVRDEVVAIAGDAMRHLGYSI